MSVNAAAVSETLMGSFAWGVCDMCAIGLISPFVLSLFKSISPSEKLVAYLKTTLRTSLEICRKPLWM